MADDPLKKLAADARERPVLYATVAVAGLAGVAAAVALTSRAPAPVRRSIASAVVRRARAALADAGESAERAADRIADRPAAARDDGAPDAPAGRDDAHRHDGGRDGNDRRAEPSAGLGGGTAAVFLGTLASKALTGWMRLRAEERARAQGAALARRASASRAQATPAAGASATGRLAGMNVTELRALASEAGIEGRSSMNKDDLVEALAGRR